MSRADQPGKVMGVDQEPELLPTPIAAERARIRPDGLARMARSGMLRPDRILPDGTMLWDPLRLRRTMAAWRRESARGNEARRRMERMANPPEPPRLPDPNRPPDTPRLKRRREND